MQTEAVETYPLDPNTAEQSAAAPPPSPVETVPTTSTMFLPWSCVGTPPKPAPPEPKRDERPDQLYALTRAEIGWTRNERTHGLLLQALDAGLVTLNGIEIRQGPRDAKGRIPRIWAGSLWDLTEPGQVRLRELRELCLPDVPDATKEQPTWVPSEVLQSTRQQSGVYKVELANGAKATVTRSDALPGAPNALAGVPASWGWSDRKGAILGMPTKAAAIESLRLFRG